MSAVDSHPTVALTVCLQFTPPQASWIQSQANERGVTPLAYINDVVHMHMSDYGYIEPSIIEDAPLYIENTTCPYCNKGVHWKVIAEFEDENIPGSDNIARQWWHRGCLTLAKAEADTINDRS